MGESIIEVRELSASFGSSRILHDISFTVYEKDITVILGGSGAGKSVLMKHLLGLYPVQQGSIQMLGKNISDLEEEEQNQLYKKLGVFYQNGGLLNSLTVEENIALPLQQHSKLDSELISYIVHTKLNLVNLPEAGSLYPSQLSGGMLKRAALARAIVMDPEILFCDEPGAGLDPVSLASLDELILNLRDQLGMSVVIVSHEVSSIKRIADRIIFLSAGRIIFSGTAEEADIAEEKEVRNFFEA